jgi:hypothetical protein
MTDAPESSLVALGTLIGTVQGVVKAIDEQNKTAAINRTEFLKVFEGIRADNKEVVSALQSHVKEDQVVHGDVADIKNWKAVAEPKVDTLWDSKNKIAGMVIGVGSLSGVAGATLTLLVQYLKH